MSATDAAALSSQRSYDVTSACRDRHGVPPLRRHDKPEVRRLAGTEGSFGEQAGLTKDWVVRIIRSVGNNGEIFARNIGVESKLGIPRGLNQLWTNGGIVYAPPDSQGSVPYAIASCRGAVDHTPPPGTKQRM